MSKTRKTSVDVFITNMNTNQKILIAGALVLGRREGDIVFPEDNAISSRHLRLTAADDAVLVEDLGSTNKTKINGNGCKAFPS